MRGIGAGAASGDAGEIPEEDYGLHRDHLIPDVWIVGNGIVEKIPRRNAIPISKKVLAPI